jgi:hypothetical protein
LTITASGLGRGELRGAFAGGTGQHRRIDDSDVRLYVPGDARLAAGKRQLLRARPPRAAASPSRPRKARQVIVTPVLAFQATVNAGATGAVTNVATLTDDGAIGVSATAVTNVGAGIAGTVFLDVNGNGVLDGGETGVGGVEVCANNGGAPVCTTSAADGTYALTGLSAGSWTVSETLATFPPGTIATSATTRTVTLAALQQVTGIDFGLQPWQNFATPGSIGDTLWSDANTNGVIDASETLLAGVTVKLWIDVNNNGVLDPAVDTQVATATSDAAGFYQFTNLAARRYLVEVDTASGALGGSGYGVVSLSGAPVANNPAAVIAVNLGSGVAFDTADFGFYFTGVIGDQLYYDTNGNGVQDGGEGATTAPIPVVLYLDVDADGALSPGIDTVVAVVQSDASGKYFFRNLPAGNYIVKPDEQAVPDPNTGSSSRWSRPPVASRRSRSLPVSRISPPISASRAAPWSRAPSSRTTTSTRSSIPAMRRLRGSPSRCRAPIRTINRCRGRRRPTPTASSSSWCRRAATR